MIRCRSLEVLLKCPTEAVAPNGRTLQGKPFGRPSAGSRTVTTQIFLYSTSHSSKLFHIQSKIKANIKLRKINLAQVMNHSRASQGVTLFFFGEPSSKGSNMSVLTRLPTPSPPPICSSPSALKLSSEPPSRVEGRRRRMGRGGRLRLSHC